MRRAAIGSTETIPLVTRRVVKRILAWVIKIVSQWARASAVLLKDWRKRYGAPRDRIGGSNNNVKSEGGVEREEWMLSRLLISEHGSFPMEQRLVDPALFLNENLL